MSEEDPQREALKRTGVALKKGEIPFALGGGYAAWVLGGPEPSHDVDFFVREADAARAERVLTEAGLTVEHPPEDWLFKVRTDGTMVDLLFRMAGTPVDMTLLDRACELEVLSVAMPVLSATDVMASKLKAMDEHYCDLGKVLPVARALREQVDWPRLREEVADNDFAVACVFLLDRLNITGS